MQSLANIQVDSGSPVEPDPLPARAARFAATPTFEAAVRAYALGQMGFRRSQRLINKLISYHARWRVVGYLLYLHADRERFGPGGGRPTATCSRCAVGARRSARAS